MDDASLRTDEEEFHSAYRVFIDALRMLGSTAAEQCESMGDFNVAWELKDDAKAGKYLVGRGYLNAEQEAWLCALAGALDAVPAQVLPAGTGRANNLAAMSHPSWIPLRVMASHALEALAPFTTENSKFLGL
ncbi:hypothetical protein ACIPRI_12535 [Variovorax sp. LARHSF232]